MKLRTYGKETYCDQDLQSFIDDLKSECNCNDGSCLFDQLLQIDGLIISNCKCGKGIINQLSQPIAVNLDSLRKQSALAFLEKPYKYSFNPIDFSILIKQTCAKCKSEPSSLSFELFQKDLPLLTFQIKGTYNFNLEKLKILKSFPETLKTSQIFNTQFPDFSLTSLQFKSNSNSSPSPSTVLLTYNNSWTCEAVQINLYEKLDSLFSQDFNLDSVSYTSQALQDPPPRLHSRFWSYLLYDHQGNSIKHATK